MTRLPTARRRESSFPTDPEVSPIRWRRVVIGWAIGIALLIAPGQASALTCVSPPLYHEVMTAGGVFEATIAARRPLDPLLFRVLEWLGRPVMNLTDRFELLLQDVEPLHGSAASTIRTGYSYLEPGGRYLFIARKRWIGPLVVGPCVGQVFEASQASAVKAWIASLSQPPSGGRLFGIVHASPNARVTARGPVVVGTVTDSRGQFEFTGLPGGKYELTATSLDSSGNANASPAATELLGGDHDAAWIYLLIPRHLSAGERRR